MTFQTIRKVCAYVSGRFDAFLQWRQGHVIDQVFLFILAVLTGLVTGAFAALLKWMIASVSIFVTKHFHPDGFNYGLLFIPVLGIVLVGIFQRYILHQNLTHGVRQLTADIKRGDYAVRRSLCVTPMIAGTLTLGFGGSAGSEGPIAYTGGAVGSNIGRIFKLSDPLMLIMIGCGAGAGIAGIFKAPIGGFLFTLEVLKINLTTMSVMALLLACVTSAMTAYVISGCTVDLSYLQMAPFEGRFVPYIIVLGVVCGLYSLYYSAIMGTMESFYNRLRNPWVRNIVSGLVLAVILFGFPAMYGEGYGVMEKVLNGDLKALTVDGYFWHVESFGWPVVTIVGGIVLLKAFACSAANCGGGVAGDFAPTLYAGCMVGFFAGGVINLTFGVDLPISGFAFCGMAGVMAGVIRAPFMALFLAAEMTNGFNLFLPLLIVTSISYGIVRIFTPAQFYATSS